MKAVLQIEYSCVLVVNNRLTGNVCKRLLFSQSKITCIGLLVLSFEPSAVVSCCGAPSLSVVQLQMSVVSYVLVLAPVHVHVITVRSLS